LTAILSNACCILTALIDCDLLITILDIVSLNHCVFTTAY